jgi:flagellar M-ring protein FliF
VQETKDLIAASTEIKPEDEKKKQLEDLARKHPEEFAKLLRTWISES